MSTMENVVKCGYLECFVRGVASPAFQWQRRFYVLYNASATNQGRLDYYENEDCYKTEPKVRKTIYLEEVREAISETDASRDYTFQLYMCRSAKRSYRFAAASQTDLRDWLKAIDMAQREDQYCTPPPPLDDTYRVLVDQNAIYESAEDFQQYIVEVQETEAAKRCHLKISTPYDLFVMSEYLCLTEKNKRVITWSYKHIRRYGCGEKNFTFEAGRKSLSGEGLFSFSVKRSEQLFRNVQDRMKHMQQKQHPEKDEFNKLLWGGAEQPGGFVKNCMSDDVSPKVIEASTTPALLPVRRTSSDSEGAPTTPLPQKPKGHRKLPGLGKQKVQQDKKSPTHEGRPIEKLMLKVPVFQSELCSKLAERSEKGVPLLKSRDQGKPPVSERNPPALGMAQSADNNADSRISKGGNYELAKATLPLSAQRKLKSGAYSDTVEERVLDANYVRAVRAPAQLPEDPEYAMYDICGSTRFQGKTPPTDHSDKPFYDDSNAYCEPVLPHGIAWRPPGESADAGSTPIYDTPAEADVNMPAPKMSDILKRLNRKKSEPQVTSEYDHIGLQPQQTRLLPAPGYYDHVVNQPR